MINSLQRDNCRIRFTHPDYSESAIISREIRTQADSIAIENFQLRAVFSVDVSTAFTAARSLGIERQRRQARNQSCEPLFTAALQGLRSLYPAVIDTCLEMLILVIDELSISQQKLVWSALDNYYADHQLIHWNNGQPWIVPTAVRSLVEGDNLTPPSQQDDSSYATWYALKRNALDYGALIRALEKPESFIRREAVLKLMSGVDTIPSHILDKILDDHPVVASTAIYALIENRESADILVANKARIIQTAGRVDVAIVLRNTLFRAGQRLKYYPVVETKAEIVLAILKAILESLPLSSSFTDDVHLDDTLENFTKVLGEAKYIEIAYIRLNYLNQQLKFHLPDDYGLCIGEFVLKYVPESESGRFEILQEFLHHPETGVAVSTVAYCTNLWDKMTVEEQNLCTNALLMERSDSRWLKATILTRYRSTPVKVFRHLSLPEDFDSLSAVETINVLTSELLGACIRMYSGIPDPLWWIGLHHSGESKWKPVIELIATMPEHDHFEYCLRRCLDWACRGDWFGGEILWRTLLEKVERKNRERLVEILFERTCNYNGAKVGDYWLQVFEVAEEKEYIEIVAKISDRINVVQYYNDEFSDFVSLFGKGQAINDILGQIPGDSLIIRICSLAQKDRISAEEASEFIFAIYSAEPPRLLCVHEYAKDIVKNISDEIFSVVEAARKATQEEVFATHNAYRISVINNEEIQDWHFCERVNQDFVA